MEPTELHCEMALLIFNKNLSGFLTEFRFWYFNVKLSVPPTSGVIPNKRGRGGVYNRNLLTFPDIYI